MNFKTITISLCVFLMLVFIPIVTADIQVNTYTPSKDFSLTSAFSDVSVCSCSTKYDSFTVTNTGTWPAIFSVTTNKIKSQLTISQSSFELTPDQSQEVFLYITADCTRGSEDLQITVTSNLGPQKTIAKKITRDRCQNIEMWASNYTKDINPCQPENFAITVHNIGPFAESYVIDSNYDKYITYNANAFNLEANQFVIINATAKFDCSMYGQKDIIFTAHSEKNKLTASIDASLNILQNYDYNVTINGDNNQASTLNVCNRVLSTQIPVSITNTGSVANNYTIQIDGLPKFAKLSDLDMNTFNLEPGKTKTFYIDIDSTVYRYEHKSKDVSIKVIPLIGDIVKESKLKLNFLACYEHQVVIYDGSNSQKRPLDTCANYDYSYDVEIINNGAFKETYTLSLEGVPPSIRLSNNKLTIPPGQRDSVKLLITGPDYSTTYNAIVKATISNGLSETDNTWIKSYDTQSCHATSIDKSTFKINYQTQYINIPIKNNGIVENSYIVSWSGSKILSPDDKILTLNSSEYQKVALQIRSSGFNESSYKGTVKIQDTSGATYNQDITIQLKDKSGIRKTFEYLAFGNTCKQFSLYQLAAILLVIVLIIIFLVKGPHYPYNFKNRLKAKTSVLVFLIVLLLIGVILVVSLAGFPQTHAQVYNLTSNNSELTYEWLQDDKYVLDVSKFFNSPENATLRYNVSGLTHIKAISSGSSITFYSDLGWSGVEYARITAYDNRGGQVTSPEFTLMVRNIPKKSFAEFYNIYCWYFNLAIYAIILVLIFIAVFVKQQKRTRK